MIKEIEEKIKEKDILLDNQLIKLTGNAFLLDNHSGYVFETEEKYPQFEKNNKHIKDILFENFIILSIGKEANAEYIDKERPDFFCSNSCEDKVHSLENKRKRLESKYSNFFVEYESCFDIEGGITINKAKEAFALNDAKKVEILSNLIVKRLKLSEKILDTMLKSESDAKSFFRNIKKEMKELGCVNYTIVPPIRFHKFSKYVEIRIYGRV